MRYVCLKWHFWSFIQDPLKQGSGALAGAYQRDFTTSYPPSPGNQLRAERTIHKVSSGECRNISSRY